jgi:hypothetical protein
MGDTSGEIEGAINSNQRAMKVQSMDQRAIGSESNRRSNGSGAWEERWVIEQWKERWVREQALREQAMNQGVRDGSRRNSEELWIREQAMNQKGIEGAIIMFYKY